MWHAFRGTDRSGIFSRNEVVGRLFRHPRFPVIFSRQGYMDQEFLRPWTRAVVEQTEVEQTDWDRIICGRKCPVALWRDETFRSTQG
jgi:hypothetical protein